METVVSSERTKQEKPLMDGKRIDHMEQNKNTGQEKEPLLTEPGNPGIEKHEWAVGPLSGLEGVDHEEVQKSSGEPEIEENQKKNRNDPGQWSVSWP